MIICREHSIMRKMKYQNINKNGIRAPKTKSHHTNDYMFTTIFLFSSLIYYVTQPLYQT